MGNSAKTATACVATIVHTIWKIMPPRTNHQYSERVARPSNFKDFETPLFMASMNGILLAGLPVWLPSIIPLPFTESTIKFEPSSDSFNQRMNEFNSLAVEFMYPRSK